MVRYITTKNEYTGSLEDAAIPLNSSMAQRMIGASICAYHVVNPNTVFFPAQFWNPIRSVGTFTLITADAPANTPAVDAAFITQTTDGWVVLSLRGTEPPSSISSWDTFKRFIDDWTQDSHSVQVPFFIGRQFYGLVHKGFHKAFHDMRMEIRHALNKIDWTKVKGLQVTGHSKGASLCFLYALWAKHSYSAIKAIEVNAFAPTPVGDVIFTNNYSAAKIPTTRHMRHWDCVPYILPFYSAADIKYDFYTYMHSSFNPTEEFFHILGKNVTGGYSTAGDIAYYTDADPYKSACMKGPAGLQQGFHDLITGIKADEGFKIPDAHSALKSYYPAVMRH